jgi:hypothetical protein
MITIMTHCATGHDFFLVNAKFSVSILCLSLEILFHVHRYFDLVCLMFHLFAVPLNLRFSSHIFQKL